MVNDLINRLIKYSLNELLDWGFIGGMNVSFLCRHQICRSCVGQAGLLPAQAKDLLGKARQLGLGRNGIGKALITRGLMGSCSA